MIIVVVHKGFYSTAPATVAAAPATAAVATLESDAICTSVGSESNHHKDRTNTHHLNELRMHFTSVLNCTQHCV